MQMVHGYGETSMIYGTYPIIFYVEIMVHSHYGSKVFGDSPGCFFRYWFSCTDSIRENVMQYNGGALLELSFVCVTCVFGLLAFGIVVLLSCRIMDRWILVEFHGGSMGFEDVPGFLVIVLLIGVISGLLMDLAGRRFYGTVWNY